jgi:hypothetical protein
MKKLALSLLLVAFVTFSCKKDDDGKESENAKTKTNTELLTNGSWKLSGATISPPIEVVPGFPISNWYSFIENCEKDNLIFYRADGSGNDDEGPTKCDPDDPQTDEFTWSFNAAQTVLTQSYGPDDTEELALIELTETSLKLSLMEEIDGRVYTITLSAVHP